MVTHTTKLNIGNPTDSLETQSIKVLPKIEFLSPDEFTVVKIKESHLLFYKSGGAKPPHKKSEGSQPLQPPPVPQPMLSEIPPIVKKEKEKKTRSVSWPFFFQLRYAQFASRQFEINVFLSISSSSSTVHSLFL